MNEAKFQSIMTNQSAVAKKIYDAVPLQEPWSTTQIISELNRRNVGVSSDKKIIQGALSSLKGSKLVREPSPGYWIRAAIHQKPGSHATGPSGVSGPVCDLKPVLVADEVSSGGNVDPIDKLISLVERTRAVGKDLVELSKAMDETVLEVQAQLESSDEETKKLKQLAALLKDLD